MRKTTGWLTRIGFAPNHTAINMTARLGHAPISVGPHKMPRAPLVAFRFAQAPKYGQNIHNSRPSDWKRKKTLQRVSGT
ncbi:hypothetical protein [Ascidiaceihabitans sp.]|uniref:hypothetical protein n=1 Tax=Ascidiaceihabitans sp. TaxID=1872644 RepID=UPI003297A960